MNPLLVPDISHLTETGPALIIFQGLPGSGKTTLAESLLAARPDTHRRVSRDHLRRMLFNSGYTPGQFERENLVTRVQYATIDVLLDHGFVVLLDDTNLNRAHLQALLSSLDPWYRADVNYLDFTATPVDVCIDRDAQRPERERVGANAIRTMYQRWIDSQPNTT